MSQHTAYSLEQAREFFLNNHTGSLTCVQGERRKLCRSYPEAVQFFNQHRESGTPVASSSTLSGSNSPQPDTGFGWASQIGWTTAQEEPSSPPAGGSSLSREGDSTPSYTGGGSDTGYTGGGGDTGGSGAGGDW